EDRLFLVAFSSANRYPPRIKSGAGFRRKMLRDRLLEFPSMSASRPQPRPIPRPGVLSIQAYVPGKSSAPGVAKIFKLSSNDTPLGPSPRALDAYRKVGAHLEDYPDG